MNLYFQKSDFLEGDLYNQTLEDSIKKQCRINYKLPKLCLSHPKKFELDLFWLNLLEER